MLIWSNILLKMRSLSEKIKAFFSVFSTYLSKEKRWEHYFVLASWTGSHLLEWVLANHILQLSKDSKTSDKQTYTQEFKARWATLWNIFLVCSMFAYKAAMNSYLTRSLAHSLQRQLVARGWLENGSLVGVEYLRSTEHPQNTDNNELNETNGISFDRILSEHINTFSESAFALSFGAVSRTVSIGISLYFIGELSHHASTAMTFLVVGFGAMVFYTYIGLPKGVLDAMDAKANDELQANISHIRNHISQISALKGESFESKNLSSLLDRRRQLSFKAMWLNFKQGMGFFGIFYSVTPLLAMLSAFIPQFIKLPQNNVLASTLIQQHVFQILLNSSSIIQVYTTDYPKIGRSLNYLFQFKTWLEKWGVFKQQRGLNLVYPSNRIRAEQSNVSNDTSNTPIPNETLESLTPRFRLIDLILKTPNSHTLEEKILLEHVNLTLDLGRYQLKGQSNCGKSTLLKALLGIWPNASGSIVYPCSRQDIHFVPQEVFLLDNSTLLESILYPSNNIRSYDVEKIKIWMEKLNLHKWVSKLDVVEDYSYLSRGEKQRLAIIGAIARQPKILFLDEATASVDPNNAQCVFHLLAQNLPNSLIIFVNHASMEESNILQENPSKTLYLDHKEKAVLFMQPKMTTNEISFEKTADLSIDSLSKQLVVVNKV